MAKRQTTQPLPPVQHPPVESGDYDIYPGFGIGPGRIRDGYEALAETLAGHGLITLDGYGGVFWGLVRERLEALFAARGITTHWINIEDALRPADELEMLVEPFLGGDDPVFGTRFTGQLRDFFDRRELSTLKPDPSAQLNIIYGTGAALADWQGFTVYLDVPKNEIQFRSRAGSVNNLGSTEPSDPKAMYKRFYFVDWVALNRHKCWLLPRIDLFVDSQRPEAPLLVAGGDLRNALAEMSHSSFRARPWFEPGAWGGQWMKSNIPGLSQDVPNYAWSFELITPENGLMLESDGKLLEISFDMLMYHDREAVLGGAAKRFGYQFPIRFDYLDTVGGGNLSLQCHPRPEYIRDQFGESFTQDETYYIVDCRQDAKVYLGFHDDIDRAEFGEVLRRSQTLGVEVEVPRYVQLHDSNKHDLFLIPNGTIHSSGEGNLVLEISATPYIFTFKLYDWLRLDLDGRPRPINIDRAFDNLRFDLKGPAVERDLKAKPVVLSRGNDWCLVELHTHQEHFYTVHRLEFESEVEVETNHACHIMCLVEGSSIRLEAGGRSQSLGFAETFVVPAAASSYRLINQGSVPAKVVRAFVKSEAL